MEGEPDSRPAIRGEHRTHPGWPSIRELAERQHGAVSRFQLLELGIGAKSIDRLIAAEKLLVVHRGVYAVGHRKIPRRGWRMAAVLSGGPEAVLSHRAAGDELDLITWNGRPSITVPKWRRSNGAIEVRSSSLPADERTALDGIPITTVSRTLLDLASVLDRVRLLSAINQAEKRSMASPLSLPSLLERHVGERGTAVLRSVLRDAGYGVADHELEELFARFVADRGLPRPELNAWILVGDHHYSPDCLWRAQRLIVELHSARHHGTAPAVTRDAVRDRRLLLDGWRVIHVTWAQLVSPREAGALELDLRAALRFPTV